MSTLASIVEEEARVNPTEVLRRGLGPEVFADEEPLPAPFKAFGIFCVLCAAVYAFGLAYDASYTISRFRSGELLAGGVSTVVVTFAHLAVLLALLVAAAVLGFRLMSDDRRHAALATNIISVLLALNAVCSIMLFGVDLRLLGVLLALAGALAFQSYVDPTLAQERRLQRKLRSMEDRTAQEEGVLGRDESGRSYLKLNFFNLFWIFVVCSLLGLLLETAFHYLIYHQYQDRTGLLFGPFSPIYGVGALLMTVSLNRLYRANPVLIFFASALIGGAFEYFTSWFMQIAFGVVAWDYTGMWLSIGGRTCGLYMAIWGLLGVLWIKLGLPFMLKVVNRIPWNWRYSLTAVCALLMAVNIVMTLESLDCWYERESGKPETSVIQRFYGDHFDNEYMAEHFQTMSMHPGRSTRS